MFHENLLLFLVFIVTGKISPRVVTDSLQTLRTSHQKEMESREEEMDQLQSTMNKKVKSLENQLEDALEEKHSAVKVCVK